MLAITGPVARVSILGILLVVRLLIAGLWASNVLDTKTLAHQVCPCQCFYPYTVMRCYISVAVTATASKSAGGKQSHTQDQA
jgi:hypothetical protein